MADLPSLPRGSSSIFSALSETFAFHSSPEAFITSRILAIHEANPQLRQSREPIRAKVLNRNVAVISSYDQVTQILSDQDMQLKLSSSEAYQELMAPFFPPPNLLLSDPPDHRLLKESWSERMASIVDGVQPRIADITSKHFSSISSGTDIDIYASMKNLSWKIMLCIFLSTSDHYQHTNHDATEVERLQEILLRGQFSLFPISVNAMLWRSPRSKGLQARQKLQSLFAARVERGASGCPFAAKNPAEAEDIASHLLLFTSSLAVKALASLLTATLLNLYLFRDGSGSSQAERLMSIGSEDDRLEGLMSLCRETERLSPPVVGVMRRVTEDIILSPSQSQPQSPATLVPKGWDLWMYFAGAARDTAIFGSKADLFDPRRYYRNQGHESLGFGVGSKACLGRELMRTTILTVAKTCLAFPDTPRVGDGNGRLMISHATGALPIGVQGWLGWKSGVVPNDWAYDMKQLPTQRPVHPLVVRVRQDLP